MVSRKALDEVIGEYDRARSYVDRAAVVLEDSSVVISSAGYRMVRKSVSLIAMCNELCVDIGRAMEMLDSVTPDD